MDIEAANDRRASIAYHADGHVQHMGHRATHVYVPIQQQMDSTDCSPSAETKAAADNYKCPLCTTGTNPTHRHCNCS